MRKRSRQLGHAVLVQLLGAGSVNDRCGKQSGRSAQVAKELVDNVRGGGFTFGARNANYYEFIARSAVIIVGQGREGAVPVGLGKSENLLGDDLSANAFK